jgi:hypothetical protein
MVWIRPFLPAFSTVAQTEPLLPFSSLTFFALIFSTAPPLRHPSAHHLTGLLVQGRQVAARGHGGSRSAGGARHRLRRRSAGPARAETQLSPSRSLSLGQQPTVSGGETLSVISFNISVRRIYYFKLNMRKNKSIDKKFAFVARKIKIVSKLLNTIKYSSNCNEYIARGSKHLFHDFNGEQ